MALTNYLLQSVHLHHDHGHGFGLFGRVDRVGQPAMVVGDLGVPAQVATGSLVWLRDFAVGPVEWLTRWLVFRRRPSFLRSSPLAAGA